MCFLILFYLEEGELPDCCGSSKHSILGGIWRGGYFDQKVCLFCMWTWIIHELHWKATKHPPPPPRINRYSTDPFPNLLLAEDAGVMSLLWPILTPCRNLPLQIFFMFHYKGETLKGTQEWEFFRLRFWILYYFIVSCVQILRFCKKNFLIGPQLEEIRLFRLVWD